MIFQWVTFSDARPLLRESRCVLSSGVWLKAESCRVSWYVPGVLSRPVRRDAMPKYEFRDAKFMGAREKEPVLRAWVRFLKNGLGFRDFARHLYEHIPKTAGVCEL